jgi:hypothetical protein
MVLRQPRRRVLRVDLAHRVHQVHQALPMALGLHLLQPRPPTPPRALPAPQVLQLLQARRPRRVSLLQVAQRLEVAEHHSSAFT